QSIQWWTDKQNTHEKSSLSTSYIEQVVNENDNNYQYHLKNAITNTTLDHVMIFFIKIGEEESVKR
ncbi:hypothetical protein WJD28_25560, partial [Salmonella enterica subsp. enterica serovar Corvallis]